VSGEKPLLSVKAWGDQVHERGGNENADEDDDADGDSEQAGDDAGHPAGEFGFAFGEEAGVNGNEGGGEDAFAEQVLKEIGDLEGGGPRVGGI